MDQYVLLTAVAIGIAWMIGFAVPTYWLAVVGGVIIGATSQMVGDIALWAGLTIAAVIGLTTAAGTLARRALRPAAR
jgi:hypothetical protein